VIDQRFQVREKLDGPTITNYRNIYREGRHKLPPVSVGVINGTPVLIDGWHRVAALKLLGEPHVDAEVRQGVSEEEARWLAAQANLAHGLRLRPKEYRQVFRAYIKARCHHVKRGQRMTFKAYREIAADIPGISHVTLFHWMKKDFPKIAHKMSQDGAMTKQGHAPAGSGKTFFDVSRNALDNALAASRGVKNPAERGELIQKAQELLEKMKAEDEWVMPVPLDEYDF